MATTELDRLKRPRALLGASGSILALASVVVTRTADPASAVGLALGAGALFSLTCWLALVVRQRRADGLPPMSFRAFLVCYAVVVVVLIAVVLILAAQDDWSELAGKSLG